MTDSQSNVVNGPVRRHDPDRVIVELCLSNSIGERFYAPTVKEWRAVAAAEAERLCRSSLPNGYFWRLQGEGGA